MEFPAPERSLLAQEAVAADELSKITRGGGGYDFRFSLRSFRTKFAVMGWTMPQMGHGTGLFLNDGIIE